MTAEEAEELKIAISANYPETVVSVTAYADGAEIVVSAAGQQDRKFKVEDDNLNSPIVRLLVGSPIT
jgi:hypothetical protein